MSNGSEPARGDGQPRDVSAVMEEVTRQMRGWLADTLEQHGDGAALEALIDQGLTKAVEETAVVAGQTMTIPELIELLAKQTALFDTVGPLRLTEGRTPTGLLVNAWRAAVHRQTRAAITLSQHGLAQEALANARSALEHAALLAAADRARRADELHPFEAAVFDAGHDQAERHLKILTALDEETGGEHQDALKKARDVLVDPKRLTARKRWWDGEPGSLFKALSDGGFAAYSFYKAASEGTHAGSGSAMPYLGSPAIGGPIIRTPIALHTAEMLAMLTWALVQADTTMDGFVDEPCLQRLHVGLLNL